jgi:hypothetical protein
MRFSITIKNKKYLFQNNSILNVVYDLAGNIKFYIIKLMSYLWWPL